MTRILLLILLLSPPSLTRAGTVAVHNACLNV